MDGLFGRAPSTNDGAEQGDGFDYVHMFEELMESKETLRSKEAHVKELQRKLDGLSASLDSARREAQEARTAQRRAEEEKDMLRTYLKETRGRAEPGPAVAAVDTLALGKLSSSLQEADRARALAEAEAEGLKSRLALQELQLKEANERAAQAQAQRNAAVAEAEQLRTIAADLALLKAEAQKIGLENSELKNTLELVQQDRDALEAAMAERARQQRTEARKHQALLLEKSHEIAAMRRQAAERSHFSGRLLKMAIEMKCLTSAKLRLEEELRAKDAEIHALKHGDQDADLPETAETVAGAPSVTSSTTSSSSSSGFSLASTSDDGSPTLQGGAAGTPAADQGAGSAPDEVQRMYGEHVQSLEGELAKLRDEVAQRTAELERVQAELGREQQGRAQLAEAVEALQGELQQKEIAGEDEKDTSNRGVPRALSIEAPSVDDLLEELNTKEHRIQRLTSMVIRLKKEIKQSEEASIAAVGASDPEEEEGSRRSRLEREVVSLQGALDREQEKRLRLEGEVLALQAETARLEDARAEAQRKREEAETLLEHCDKEWARYYEEAISSVNQKFAETDWLKKELQRLAEVERSLTGQLSDTQRAAQMQTQAMAKMQAAKNQAVQALEAMVQELDEIWRRLEAESPGLDSVEDVEGSGLDSMLARISAAVDVVSEELTRLRGETLKRQDAMDRAEAARAHWEQVASTRQSEMDGLQAKMGVVAEEQESLKRQLKKEQDELQKLEQFKRTAETASVQDSRKKKSGHVLQLRMKNNFNCSVCLRVKHDCMWKCGTLNCMDRICSDCLGTLK